MTAAICDRLHAQSEEMPVGVDRQFCMRLVVAPLIVGDETFAACADPFYWPTQAPRRPGDDGFFRIMLTLVAEAAADIGRDQPNIGLRQIELFAHRAPDVMWHLRGAIERQLAAGAAVGQHRAWLDRRANQSIIEKIEPNDVRRTGNDFSDACLVASCETKADITWSGIMQLWSALAQRGFGIGDRGQRFVIDVHKIGSVAGLQ